MEKRTVDLGLDTESAGSLLVIQEHMRQIWDRARSNAFAHRIAAERNKMWSTLSFVLQVSFGIVGVLFVLFVYIFTSSDQISFFESDGIDEIVLTILSVVSSILSLFFSIIQNYMRFEQHQLVHDHNQHSFLYIAQRAREVRFPGMDRDKALGILQDLERDFQLLKARGREPRDWHFRKGDALLEELKSNKEKVHNASSRQSFSEMNE